METIEINGKSYLIDTEKAIEQGLLKEKDSRPRSWGKYATYFSDKRKGIVNSTCLHDDFDDYDCPYDTFNSKDEAKAFCALGKLIQLRDAWWGEWRPNWNEVYTKYTIVNASGYIDSNTATFNSRVLAFPTKEMATDFLSTFQDLIEQAKMFL